MNYKPSIPRVLSSNFPISEFKNYMRRVNWLVLQTKIGADNESKVACLEPDCCHRMDSMETEKRKGWYVLFLLNLVSAGVAVDELPYICNCEELPCGSADSYVSGLTINEFDIYGA